MPLPPLHKDELWPSITNPSSYQFDPILKYQLAFFQNKSPHAWNPVVGLKRKTHGRTAAPSNSAAAARISIDFLFVFSHQSFNEPPLMIAGMFSLAVMPY